MDAKTEREIMGYFIEEVTEYVDLFTTILLDLPQLSHNPEPINELLRAGISIKGGGVMLGFNNIHTIIINLESFLSYIQKHPVIDDKVHSLFTRSVEVVKQLLTYLESGDSRPEEEKRLECESYVIFQELQNYLQP